MKNYLTITNLVAVAFGLGVLSASANPITYTASSSSTSGPLDAEVQFSISGNEVTVTVTDLEQDPTSAGQLVSGVTFDVTGATGHGSLTTVNSGLVSTIDVANGTYTAGTSSTLTRWTAHETGTGVDLTTLSGGQPADLIIGPDSKGNFDPTLGGLYNNANASIGNFNPAVLGVATFTIDIPGILSGISTVDVQFGTNPDHTLVASCPVPDGGNPALLLGAATFALGLIRRKLSA